MVGTKRRHDGDDTEEETPRKMRASATEEVNSEQENIEVKTPSRRGRTHLLAENGTPRSILKKSGLASEINGGTPKSTRKLVFDTPTKPAQDDSPNGTPTIVRNADRSARRKSNRRILERTLNGEDSEEEVLDEGETLAEQILGGDTDTAPVAITVEEAPAVPETPSKRGRGRPKGSFKKKPREPTPPTELPAYEEYFWQNRPGGAKTSNNTLSAQQLLNHDEYFQTMQSYEDRHRPEIDFLGELHARAFDQWIFELNEGFNICLFGYGSKRIITEKFTQRLYEHRLGLAPHKGTKNAPKIVVINGYTPGTTIKDILVTVASTCVPANTKIPNQPTSLLDFILEYLTNNGPPHPIPIILNSIDSPYLRRAPTPSMLARLAAHPSINLVCTADTPNFPLLWDVGLKTQYKFLFHDATTFAPYTAEIDVVESVNELLGRNGRRVGGKDGVSFVLRSLPESARTLFQMLVMEQLAQSFMDDAEREEQDSLQVNLQSKKAVQSQSKPLVSESSQGIEYRVMYHKAVEALVCTSEVAFRSQLKEFHDHQMIESSKDAMGTERLWIPFRQEELEALAEDLAGDAF